MMNDQLVEECIRIIDAHEGKPQTIPLDDAMDEEVPDSILQHSPSRCMITTNSLSCTWQVAPFCFWTLEVSPRPFNLVEMREFLAGNEYTRDLVFDVVDHGKHWVVMESFN